MRMTRAMRAFGWCSLVSCVAVGWVALGVAAGACRAGSSEPSREKSGETAQPAACAIPSPPPPPSGSPSGSPPPQPAPSLARPEDRLLDLNGRFQKEAASRPTGTPRVEDVFAAIGKAGFTFDEQRQHLASPFLAAYCVGAKTQNDVALSVCEYTSAEEAKRGLESSSQMPIANRAIHLNVATTLTVRQGARSADSDAAVKKIVAAFAGVRAAAAK